MINEYTQIFLLHIATYQPSVSDYVYTNTYYGSCSGCDTLLAISHYNDGYPNDKQVEDYMTPVSYTHLAKSWRGGIKNIYRAVKRSLFFCACKVGAGVIWSYQRRTHRRRAKAKNRTLKTENQNRK